MTVKVSMSNSNLAKINRAYLRDCRVELRRLRALGLDTDHSKPGSPVRKRAARAAHLESEIAKLR